MACRGGEPTHVVIANRIVVSKLFLIVQFKGAEEERGVPVMYIYISIHLFSLSLYLSNLRQNKVNEQP